MKKVSFIFSSVLILNLFCNSSNYLFSQQIADGYAPSIGNFSEILQSGVYGGAGAEGRSPDDSYNGAWQHLFVIRHANPSNNHQFQMATAYTDNDRLFFRKIAGPLTQKSPAWNEIATRGTNTFTGSQTINGEVFLNSLNWNYELFDISASPRTNISPMSMKMWDHYSYPTDPVGIKSYGTVLELYGRYNHETSQLFFGYDGIIRHRNASYLQPWTEWNKLLDSKNNVESSGLLQISGNGNHYILNGNVGIGTPTPRAKLDVSYGELWVTGSDWNGTAIVTSNGGKAYFGNNTYNNGLVIDEYGNLGIGTSLTNLGYKVNIDAGGTAGLSIFNCESAGNSEIRLGSAWSRPGVYSGSSMSVLAESGLSLSGRGNNTDIYIDNNGKVGIGTTAPDALLTVNGTIHAKDVKIDLNGPLADFVFAKEYNLRSLVEVENFITTNNHLPEMPSAKEVAKEGLSVGEMQNKLLQKVEELTLYLIEQNKKIELQQKEIDILKTK